MMKHKSKRKGKMGRPPVSDAARLSAQVLIRMTKADRRGLERSAKAAGQDISAFVRAAIRAAREKQKGAKQ